MTSRAKPDRQPPAGRLVGIRRRDRAGLLRSTALQAAVLVAVELPGGLLPAAAQPAPNARPQGGRVVAGQASISQSPSTTTIDQSSQRAAINWNSFNVGSQQSVDFQQPSASAITLNRVTGADPSQIAGHIQANGQIVLTNPSGVVFYRGSEVNAQSVVVSAAGITNRNFMAGRMVFDRAPHPNARIVNAGSITVKQAGLAALVAPQVANSGVITAKLGHVVLAGALTHTIDMYGDGLLSFDVTREVKQVPRGPDGKPATELVTNTGTILASGGTVQLTARAADGIVQDLVDAKGRVTADSVGARSGSIVIAGTGGSVVIAGNVAAAGVDPGTRGGQIELDASRDVVLAKGARVDASGRSGGGTVAIGTTLARANGGPSVTPKLTAQRTLVARGARVAADATHRGKGGKVTVLSTEATAMRGRIDARGGTRGGDGGLVEVSGERGFALTGVVDVSARGVGRSGTVLLDPTDLDVVAGLSGSGNLDGTLGTNGGTIEYNVADGGTPSTVSTGELQNLITLGDNIALQASHDLDVQASISGNFGTSIDLRAGHLLTVETGVTIAGASIRIDGGEIFPVTDPTALPTGNGGVVMNGTLIANFSDNSGSGTIEVAGGSLGVVVNGAILAPGQIFLSGGGSTGVQLNANSVLAGGSLGGGTFTSAAVVDLNTTGPGGVAQDPAGLIVASGVQSSFGVTGDTNLLGTANQIASLNGFASTGDFTLKDSSLLVVGGAVSVGTGNTLTLIQDQLAFDGGSLAAPGGTVALAPLTPGLAVDLGSAGNPGTLDIFPFELSAITAGTLQIGSATAGRVNIGDTGCANDTIDLVHLQNPISTLNVLSGASVTEGGILVVGTLAGAGSSATLSNANSIATLGSFSTTGGFALADTEGLTVAGPVGDGAGITLNVTGPLVLGGALGAPTVSLIATGAITEPGGSIAVGTLSGSGTSVSLLGAGNTIGTLAGFAATAGDFALSSTGDLAISGAVASGGTVDLIATGAIGEVAGGGITAATLTGSAGSANLDQGNFVAQLGNFSTGSGFVLIDGEALSVGGSVADGTSIALTSTGPMTASGTLAAPTIALTANPTGDSPAATGSITQTAGSIGGSTGVVLTATGSIDQTGGVLAAGTLSGSSGGATTLAGAGNAVGNLGGFTSTGGFTLTDGTGLTVPGPVSDSASIGLTVSGPLALAGTLTAPDITLNATGAITQPAGALLASGTLSGSGDGVALGQAGNSIADLGAFTSTLDFLLADSAPLAVANTVSVGTGHTLTLNDNAFTVGAAGSLVATGGTIALAPLTPDTPVSLTGTGAALPYAAQTLVLGSTTAGPVTIGGTVNLSGVNVLDLLSAGAITEAPGAVLSVGTLTGSGASATLNATNTIATLGSFSTTGGFSLADARGLTVGGPVTDPPGITLDVAGPLAISSLLSAPTISLTATGAISEPGGTIVAGTLSGSGTSVSLIAPGNIIATLAGFAATTGDFALTSQGDLAIGGAVSSGGTVALVASGTIGEVPGGSVTAATLTGSAGLALLTSTANTVSNLGNFTTGGGFTLTDAGPLTVGGPVSDGTLIALTSSGPLTVAGSVAAPAVELTATNLSLRGRVTAPGDIIETSGSIGGSTNVVLTAAGSIDQTGGVLVAGTLSGSSGGTTTLAGAGNAVANLGSFSSAGGFALTDGTGLAVAGPVGDTASIGLNVTGPLALGGTLSAPAIGLTATGAITQPAGALLATTLSGSGDGVALGQAANSIADLGAFASPLDFLLADSVPVTVAGAVAAGSGHTLTLNDNAFTLGAVGSLAAPAGTVVLAPLTPGTPVSLTGTGAALSATAETLVLGSPTAGPVGISGTVNLAGVNVLDLLSGGAITETAGAALSVGTLTGSGASATLNATNTIATLGSFSTTGGFALADTEGLTVAGPVGDGAGITLNVTGPLVLGGALGAPTVSLIATGAITEPGGSIAAGTLSGSGTSVSLLGAGNTIGTLAGFAATAGDFALSSTGDLAISGAVASGGTVDLIATGAIGEVAGGGITAATLTGSAGSANLDQGNFVAQLGNFSTGSGFVLIDGEALSVGGSVADGTSIALTSTGPMTASGTLAAPTIALTANPTGDSPAATGSITQTAGSIGGSTGVVLTATGSIDQTGGVLAAGTLSGSSGGATTLAGAGNAVGNLGGFTSTGGFTLTDGTGLTVPGPVSDSASIGLTVSGPLALAGTLTAPDIALNATGAITQPAGALLASGTLSGSGDGVALGQAANGIGTLGGFASALDFALADGTPVTVAGAVAAGSGHTLALSDNQFTIGAPGSLAAPTGTIVLAPLAANTPMSLTGTGAALPDTAQTLVLGSTTAGPVTIGGTVNLSGVNVLDLLSAGAITEAPGAVLSVGTLTGSGASATLNATNTIATLGSFSTTGGFSLADARGLTVGGPVTDPPGITLDVAGPLAISSLLSAPTISLTATGAISEPGGTIVAGTLSGSGTSVSLIAPGNIIATLAGFAATTGDFALTSQGDLAIGGAVSSGGTVALVASGTIGEVPGGSVTAATLTGSAGLALLTSTTNTVSNLGNFTTGGGFTLTDAGPLTVGGPVSDGTLIALTSSGPLTVAGSVAAPAVELTATNLSLRGRVTAPGDIIETSGSIGGSTNVVLTAAGSIDQTGGVLVAGTLSGSSGGTTTLAGAGNAVANLGSFSSAGGFALTDGTGLAVAGPVGDTASIGLNVTGPLALGGTLTAPAIGLTATGAITQPAGALLATTLSGSGDGVALGQAANSIADLGAFTSPLDFLLADSAPLTVANTVSVGTGHTLTLNDNAFTVGAAGSLAAPAGTVVLAPLTPGTPVSLTGTGAALSATAETLVLGSPAAGPVGISGTVNLAGVNVLDLLSGGAITETAGAVLSVGTLTGGGASATLNATNTIATLGSFSTTGGFALADTEGLTVAGPVGDGAGITLNVTGPLVLGGALTAPNISLTATGAITQPAGALLAGGTLSGSGDGVALGQPANGVGTLGGFASPLDFALADGAPLTVAGAVVAGSGHTLALSDGQITLGAGGSLAAPAGTIVLAPLAAGAPISLTGTGAALQATAETLVLGSPSAGRVTLGGDINLSDVRVLELLSESILTGGTIAEAPGAILTVGTVTGSGGVVSLNATNSIAMLGRFSADGGFALTDGQGLTVAGPLTSSSGLVLNVTGDLALAGALGASTVSLTTTGAITELGGSIAAGALTGSAGFAALGGGNAIVSLGSFTTAGGFALTNGQALTIAGPVSAGGGLALNVTGDLTLTGTLGAPTVNVTASGALTEAGGSIAATTLSGSAAAAALGSPSNAIAALAGFVTTNPGYFALADTGQLAVTGPLTSPGSVQITTTGGLIIGSTVSSASVNLQTPGTISEVGAGQVLASALSGSAGAAALTGGNAIAVLSSFTAPGGFALTDTRDLTLAGTVIGGSAVTLTVQGGLLLGFGSLSGTGTVAINASGPINDLAASVAAGTLTGSASGSAQFGSSTPGATAAIGTLGPFSVAGGTLALTDSEPLRIDGPISADDIAITATGSIVLAGGTIATLGLPLAAQLGTAPAAPGSYLQVLAGGDGTGTFRQLGTTIIDPPNGVVPTLRIQVPDQGGTITLNDLVGPTTNLVLANLSGPDSGTIDVGSLNVIGQTGLAGLFGTVAGVTGPPAAPISSITPAINPAYLLNGCVIMSATCTLPPSPPPPTPPPPPPVPPVPPVVILPPINDPALLVPPNTLGRGFVPGEDQMTLDAASSAAAAALGVGQPLIAGAEGDEDELDILPNISDRDY